MSLLDRAPWLTLNDATEELLADLEQLFRRPAWQADAACRAHPEIEFVPRRGGSTELPRAVCAGCLVRDECRSWALDQGEQLVGVWGGLSHRARTLILRGHKTVDDFPPPARTLDEMRPARVWIVSSGHRGRGRCAACPQVCEPTPERPENRLKAGFCPRCHQAWVRWRQRNGDDRDAFIAQRAA